MTAPRATPRFPGDDRPLRVWQDRRGRAHQERRPDANHAEPETVRVAGPLEEAWRDPSRRSALARRALERENPHVVADPDDPDQALWTWVVEDGAATAVVLWTNPVFDHREPTRAEFSRLDGSNLWTICLRLPASLRASYRIGFWREEGPPPWRTATGRRPVILAAMGASEEDPRGGDAVVGSRGETSSVGSGPAAPAEPWRDLPTAREAGRTEELDLPGRERAWIHRPAGAPSPTPLLVLFDGQVWRAMGLPALLDRMTSAGVLPPLHVAMLDSGDQEARWERLGVPGGQVETVIDELLPRVRDGWGVDPRGAATVVAGQSLGGIGALWAAALGGGEIGHAIAQSPSLWRFDVAEALLTEPAWRSLALEAGSFERYMLGDAHRLAERLRGDPRLAGRSLRVTGFAAGHDWAVWRANLLRALVGIRAEA